MLTTLLMAVVPMIGCSPTGKCESVCAQWNACKIDQRAVDFECSFLCNDVEAQQDRAAKAGQPDCKAEYEAHLDCWQSSSAQICNKEFTDCRATGTAWTTCMRAYCGYVRTEKLTDQNCANGNTTFVPFN